MKISRKKFVVVFLVSAFAFQFISNSLLGDAVELFPNNGNWYPGADSPIAWKKTLASVIYPVKYILMQPVSFLGQDADVGPPILLVAFAVYWSAIALVIHFLLSILFNYKIK